MQFLGIATGGGGVSANPVSGIEDEISISTSPIDVAAQIGSPFVVGGRGNRTDATTSPSQAQGVTTLPNGMQISPWMVLGGIAVLGLVVILVVKK